MQKVTFRLFEPRLNPQRTKYQIPGWMGEPEPRRDGSHEHAWHCVPFTEGAQYGIELFYPFDNELRVSRREGRLVFDGDLGNAPGSGVEGQRFRSFGEDYYTYQLLLDLKVGDDFAVLTQPHPRFYTDTKDETPIAVPALLRTSWWPMISFVVFKSPTEGRTHVFRPGEPFMQMLIVPPSRNSSWSPWVKRKRPNARCAAAEFTPAGIRSARTQSGCQQQTLFLTEPTGTFTAPPSSRRRKSPDADGPRASGAGDRCHAGDQ